VGRERELGDNAEVAAPAAFQRPQQVGVRVRVGLRQARVQVNQLGAGADRRGAGVRVDRDRVELAQIKYDALRGRRVAGVAVPA
jgi:hypothetical protein